MSTHRLIGSIVAVCVALLSMVFGAVVAQASSSCPNELFRTGPGANLPDCRAYELVSPAEKNGGEVEGGPMFEGTVPAPMQAAADGEAVTYGSETAFPGTGLASSPITTQYLSRRGPDGWSTQAIDPEQNLPGGVLDRNQGAIDFSLFMGFSEDLEHGFLAAYEPSPVPGAPAGYYSPYVRNDLTGEYQLLSRQKPPVQPPGASDTQHGFRIEYAGMSADGSHAVFAANDALTPREGSTPAALPGKGNLYESSDGHLELVSVLPDGKAAEAASRLAGPVFGRLERDEGGLNEGFYRVISADGKRVFWTYPEPNGEGRPDERIFMHEQTQSGYRSVEVSASQKTNGTGPGGTDPAGPLSAVYQTASTDGSEVFFTSCEKLTNDSTAGPPDGNKVDAHSCAEHRGTGPGMEREGGQDLYRYETSTGKLSDLTVDPVPGQTAAVTTVLGASEDGAYVYFVARGVLAPGALNGPFDEYYNIYLWHNGEIKLIAPLHGSKNVSTEYEGSILFDGHSSGIVGESFVPYAGSLEWNNVRVSPNGQYLVFESVAPLVGNDTSPVEPGVCEAPSPFWGFGSIYKNATGHCLQVYEYDANAGRLICASCSPRGLPPAGDSIVPFPVHALAHFAGWQSTTVQQRYLLDDGRLFFESTGALLPQASNGKLNVYEYEPDAVGGCQREGGCIALISTGTSNEDSFFVDASASGNDVFFTSRQQLVAQDGDEAMDLYDARVDGGFAAATPPPCGGEACRPPVTPAPAIYGAPPSATFVGAGNSPRPTTVPTPVKAKQKVKHKSRRKVKRRAKRARARRADGHKSSRRSSR